MQNNKFDFTGETVNVGDKTLHRIRALMSFGDVKAGDLGGFVEKSENLSDYGNAWVYNDAKVYENAIVRENAIVCDNAHIHDNATVCGSGIVCGYAHVYGDAWISGTAYVYDVVCIYDNARVRGNARICGYTQIFNDAIVMGDCHIYNTYVSGKSRVHADAKITSNVLNMLQCCEFPITAYYCDNINAWYIQVGCKLHTASEWLCIIEHNEYAHLCSDYTKTKAVVSSVLAWLKL